MNEADDEGMTAACVVVAERDSDGDAEHKTVTETVTVTVDDRERASEVPALLEQTPGVRVRVARLRTGDYCVGEDVVIERKTVRDLEASLLDGRLFRQAKRLAACPGRIGIILEGDMESTRGDGVSRECLLGALVSLTLVFGIPVLRSAGAAETARLIVYASRQLERSGRHAWHGRGGKPKSPHGRRLRVLQGLPGIGRERAERLLEAFGTVRECLCASEDELARVPGIGSATARRMRELLD